MSSTQELRTPCTCSTESRRSSASAASAATTSSSSSATPAAEPTTEMNSSAFVSQAPNYPLPAYARDFPKPIRELDIEEALNRKPGRWTFRGTVEASLKKQPRPLVAEDDHEEARSEAYAAAKKSLLESAAELNAGRST